MKLTVILLLFVLFSACSIEEEVQTNPFIGEWQWDAPFSFSARYIVFDSTTYERYDDQVEVYEYGDYFYDEHHLNIVTSDNEQTEYNIVEITSEYIVIDTGGFLPLTIYLYRIDLSEV